MRIGPHQWPNPTALAPMAGVTDRPFRQLCRRLGAGYAVSEMVTSQPSLRNSRKSRWRSDHRGEAAPIAVQIVGTEPALMAEAARYNVSRGAQIIDINMGCPAKKVCKKLAGSALLGNEPLVRDILTAVIEAVPVPVTLKIRTGLHQQHINGVTVARIAEDAGIQALAVHGRTRAQMYKGRAEYETIREIVGAVDIPVIANGDIENPEKAHEVLRYTGANAVMVGRAAQGNPWIFRQICYYLDTGTQLAPPGAGEVGAVLIDHLRNLHRLYGAYTGVRVARKHIGWYLKNIEDSRNIRQRLMRVKTPEEQLQILRHFFGQPPVAADCLAA